MKRQELESFTLKDGRILDKPKPVGYVTLFPNITLSIYGKMPNKFHQLMIRLFFGFKINEYDQNK